MKSTETNMHELRRASKWIQFISQLRKCFLVKQRSPIRTLFEILVPVALLGALAGIKTTTDINSQNATDYSQSAWNIPDMNQLMNFPTNLTAIISNPVSILQYAWYLQYANQFAGHGGANLAWQCYTGGDVTAFSLDSCQSLMFAVIPEDSTNQSQVDAANAFKSYWISKYPDIAPRIQSSIVDDNSLNEYIQSDDYGSGSKPPMGLAVVFSEGAPNWQYAIRVNRTSNYGDGGRAANIPSTTKFAKSVDNLKLGQSSYTKQYLLSGFLTVQRDVDSFIIGSARGDANFVIEPSVFAMPTPSYISDPFWSNTASTFGLFMMLSMLYPVAMVVQTIVTEKDTKLKELMLMMGMRPVLYHTSWLVVYAIMYLLITCLLTGISKINLFVYSSASVVFVYFLLFTLSSLAFGFFVASLFERTNVAVVVGLLLYFIGYFLYAALNGSDIPVGPQIIVSLIPSTAFCFGTISISDYEGGLVGLNWSNIRQTGSSSYSMSVCMSMLLFDTILYTFLGFFLDAVIPTSLGASRQKWWTLFTCGFRCRSRQTQEKHEYKHCVDLVQSVEKENVDTVYQPVPRTIESLRDDGKCIMLSGLCKTYKSDKGPVNAVNELSATFYEGQITALLGPNGAGKSTVINMLCGLVPITDGDAFVGGLSCTDQMDHVRLSLGVCPQINVLFPNLTVREHLQIFAGIKGYNNCNDAIEAIIAEVGLTQKMNVYSRDLSGGMKRKLQLAIALFGDSKFIILDEPTSGMDPYSRRFTWDAIERHREGRTIILTTHFMDEADLLGDRIAIMAQGEMTCFGTSLFLKKKFGVGYQMTLEMRDNKRSSDIVDVVQKFVPEATVVTNIGSELTLQLPLDASPKFENLLCTLNDKRDTLQLVNTGISVTTLELVFLRVAQGTVPATSNADMVEGTVITDTAKSNEAIPVARVAPENIELIESTMPLQVSNLMLKRFQYAKRDRRAWCCQFVTPLVFLLLGFITFSISPNADSLPLWFDGATNLWNLPSNPNPIPYNVMNYSGQSSTETMQYATMPRISLQAFTNIANVSMSYCQTESWYVGNIASAVSVLSAMSQDASAVMSFLKSFLYTQTGPVCTSTDLYNASTEIFSNDLDDSRTQSVGSRYGALMFLNLSETTSAPGYTIAYNSTGVHAAPQMMNMVDSAMLQQSNGTSSSIAVATYAFPKTQSESAMYAGFVSFTATLAIAIAFSFVPSSFALFIVREKEQKSWHQQLINGTKPTAYWLSNWVFDYITFLIPSIFAWICIAAFKISVLQDQFGLVILIFLLYGISITSFTYCCTFLFSNHRYSQFAMIGINLFSGMILLVVAFTMDLVDTTYQVNDALMYLYRLFPTFAFAHALLEIATIQISQFLLNSVLRGGNPAKPIIYKPMDLQIAGTDIIYLAIECVAYTLLLLWLQNRYRTGVIRWSWPKCLCCQSRKSRNLVKIGDDTERPASHTELEPIDADVQEEASRIDSFMIQNMNSGDLENGKVMVDDAVILHHIRKVYPARSKIQGPKVAVENLTLGIRRNECFGLLGINGAGKTTTMSMLTGDFPPTSGTVLIDNINVVENLGLAQKRFGYCPQFDAIFDLLTAREHLRFYARMKGVPENQIESIVEHKIVELGLSKHADKMAGGYSGGNKRKLSVAMATIGNPTVVFLDEPSTGMDPVSRRFMWDVIAGIVKQTSVILTTHSMEECEALCTRIGIMVDGGLKCLGSSQHLKQVYGQGYQLEINIELPSTEAIEVLLKVLGLSSSNDVSLDEANVRAIVERVHPGLFDKEFCIGGTANLLHQKLRYGELTISVMSLAEWYYVETTQMKIEEVLQENFPGFQLIERQGVRLRYALPENKEVALSRMFGIIEEARDACNIQGYSLGQTTLESVFNSFASKQSVV